MEQAVSERVTLADPDRLLNFVGELGFRLIRNGAEIYRVEESIERIINAYGYENCDVFVLPTLILVNILTEEKNYSKAVGVRSSANNLERLDKFNALCRKICNEKTDIDTAEKELREIASLKTYPLWVGFLSFGLVATFFTLFWGGGILDAVVAFFCGLVVKFTVYSMNKLKANGFFTNLSAGALLAVLPTILSYFPIGIHLDKIIIGAIMLLVPGVAIINVMRDILAGDFLTAVIKFAEVIIVAVGISIGIAIPITVIRLIATSFFI